MTIHKEKRVIHHRPQDLYALVADVRSYPDISAMVSGVTHPAGINRCFDR